MNQKHIGTILLSVGLGSLAALTLGGLLYGTIGFNPWHDADSLVQILGSIGGTTTLLGSLLLAD